MNRYRVIRDYRDWFMCQRRWLGMWLPLPNTYASSPEKAEAYLRLDKQTRSSKVIKEFEL